VEKRPVNFGPCKPEGRFLGRFLQINDPKFVKNDPNNDPKILERPPRFAKDDPKILERPKMERPKIYRTTRDDNEG